MDRYEISASQQQALLNQGYTLLKNAVPADLLAKWQQRALELEQSALDMHQQGNLPQHICVHPDPVGQRVMRYDDIIGDAMDESLDLLACPAMIAVFEQLAGPGALPIQMDLLYKHQHPHPVILWHQGAPHPRGYPYLNVGIYLDDANQGDGCLRYVPGTQHELQDIIGLSKTHGWNIPGVVEQPAQAGDILIQDMMILHGSQPKWSKGTRRTIYVEVRPAEGIIESGAQSQHWADLKQRWMGLVSRRALQQGQHLSKQTVQVDDLKEDAEEVARILALREPPIPAVYGHGQIISDDYPVPSDLQVQT